MRVGIGYDMHRLIPDRKLVLGGIHIPYEKGLAGHSDADVLVHALCDALLGAAGLGDIGMHFPDTDPAYKDADSILLLQRTWEMVSAAYGTVVNIDATVFAQAPKLGPHRNDMAARLAEALGIDVGQINIKATTTEGMGLIGSEAAMAAMCVVMLK